ncbi:bacillithiol biosynthesis cysteine-adding enzyme BshC [Sporosarcina sp. G11-34]|uniref:bacillithiol biosynthesis cysteine-adding enzyme BshC n=1 Tax=Sporosarcina sp. G11-34 TaxID=2849605 RepID=UPI0022A8DED9|nr:bacillithiol biosynthesis cysteine-adding enzyme BshC [Sporosarcina sp. G11-34]MCZ2257119.1 bacillithiol biosynthesis cysteine-adding enzyme BshC [Sporosarcina sp. G11-34]
MKLNTLALPEQNMVMHSYNNDLDFIHRYFDYENKESSFTKRAEELSKRPFNRQGVAETVRQFMKPFGISENAERHIEELGENAVTVIGGQQAGILTGPLYSVHKAITVILLAKKQREALGIPVVPVFWVAGEDHDLNEINHVYTEMDGRVTKEQIQDKFILKLMASDATFNQDEMRRFVSSVFSKFGETAYTKTLLNEVLDTVKKENTFTGFFVSLMNGMFADEGLLFIDSAFKPLRELESDYFCMLINESETIARSIFEMEQQFDRDGYGKPLEVQEDASHLFYVHETGRALLTRRNGYFVNDSAGLRFSEEEMLEIAKKTPALLSNNVSTRPLMQDLVLPVLAFVGGPGEITYWAVLKEAFHTLGIKMPVIVPRLSLTLVSRKAQTALAEKSFEIEDVMNGEVAVARHEFIEGLRDGRFEEAVNEVEKKLTAEYEKMSQLFGEEETMMLELLQRNLQFHTSQFKYIKEKSEDAQLVKHEVAVRMYDSIETELLPNGGLQERVYTPYVHLNSYGPTLIQDLLRLPFEMDGTHKVVYL